MQYGWYDAESAVAFLLNIPARFDFECALYEAKAARKSLTPTELSNMTTAAWKGR
jgi:oligoendopeptidase F